MAAPVAALRQRRFELFHASMAICGAVIAVGSLLDLARASTGVSSFDVLGLVTGIWFVGWGFWHARHRSREEWARDVEGFGLAIWAPIVMAAVFVVLAVYELLAAL